MHSSGFMAGDRLVFLQEVVSALSPGREEARRLCLEGTDGKLARAEGEHGHSPTPAVSGSEGHLHYYLEFWGIKGG